MKKARHITLNESSQQRNQQNRKIYRTQKFKINRQHPPESRTNFKSKSLIGISSEPLIEEQIYKTLENLNLPLEQPNQQVLLIEDLTQLLESGRLKTKSRLKLNKNGDKRVATFVAAHFQFFESEQVDQWINQMSQLDRKCFYKFLEGLIYRNVDYLTLKVIKTLISDLDFMLQSASLIFCLLKENKLVPVLLHEGLASQIEQILLRNHQRPFIYYQICAVLFSIRPDQIFAVDLLRILFGNVQRVVQSTIQQFTGVLLELILNFPSIVRQEEVISAVHAIQRQSIPKLIRANAIRQVRDTLRCLYVMNQTCKRLSVQFKLSTCTDIWKGLEAHDRQNLEPYLSYVLHAQSL